MVFFVKGESHDFAVNCFLDIIDLFFRKILDQSPKLFYCLFKVLFDKSKQSDQAEKHFYVKEDYLI